MFNNKYKERKPQETIEIIKNFFEEKGYSIEITSNYKSESSTWSCHIILTLNGNEILGSNGKGTTEDYSMASGFAELYERFCNSIFYLNSPIVLDAVMQERYNKFGYYLDKEEKFISF